MTEENVRVLGDATEFPPSMGCVWKEGRCGVRARLIIIESSIGISIISLLSDKSAV